MPADKTLFLWPDGSPHNYEKDRPRMEIFLPKEESDKPRTPGMAVVVCPGGGYGGRAGHEGPVIGEFLAANGIVGIVCHYRVSPNRHPAPMTDACRAVRMTRSMAKELNIDDHKVAIMGFSAGGHLASTVAVQPNLHVDKLDDLAEKFPARPDRAILCYPVITMSNPKTHGGSVNNLLGKDATDEMKKQMSSELQVNNQTPPTFIFHTWDDGAVPVQNALLYANACAAAGVKCEMHIYETGRHGVGLALDNPRLKSWSGPLIDWLKAWK